MKKSFLYTLCLTGAILFSACEDRLELQPQQSLSTSEALADLEGLQTAMIGAYDRLQDLNYYGRDYMVIPEAGGDDILISPDNSNRFLRNNDYVLTPDNTQGAFWNDAYNLIARVNNVIDNIGNAEGASQQEIDRLLGQAHFLRALAHFDLVRTFGGAFYDAGALGVPVILKTEIGEPARNTMGEVYAQVISDFNEAIRLLDDSQAPFFASAIAARALLSRVYLYQRDYAASAAAASDVINSGQFTLLTDSAAYISSWDATGSSEEIFTLAFQNDESRGADNLGSIYIDEGYGDLRPTLDFLDILAPEDIRNAFIRVVGGDEYTYKYNGQGAIPGLHSPRVIRYAEVILNRAEANAQAGNTAAAIEDLNTIRTRAGLAAINPTGAQVLEEIYLERRRELFVEGQRAFDIFRRGQDLVRGECNLPGGVNCTVPFSSHLIRYPIPRRETDVNQNMVQNPGYN